MVHEATNQSHQNHSIDREVRDMVNAITSKVTGGSHHHHHHRHEVEEDETGVRIITLAGTNTGATMRTELDDDKPNVHHGKGASPGLESDASGTYVNSNFQAVNNSIMLGSNYSTNDPGVHLDISDLVDHHLHKHGKKGKKKDKKDKEPMKSDRSSE